MIQRERLAIDCFFSKTHLIIRLLRLSLYNNCYPCRTLCLILDIYMDMFRLCTHTLSLELLFSCGRGLYLSRCCRTFSACHDGIVLWRILIHIQYVNECNIWIDDRYWDY